MELIRKINIIKYYLFSYYIGRHFYQKSITKSIHFSHISSVGWKWIYYSFFWQKIMGINRHVPWPVSFKNIICCPENIIFDVDDINNFMTQGNYFQASDAKLIIGKGTFIAPNVAIITENHDVSDPSQRSGGKNVIIGKKCWIGINSVILPGVTLGDHTVVAAGSIVTKSYAEGNCVIAGNPAKVIKNICNENN